MILKFMLYQVEESPVNALHKGPVEYSGREYLVPCFLTFFALKTKLFFGLKRPSYTFRLLELVTLPDLTSHGTIMEKQR